MGWPGSLLVALFTGVLGLLAGGLVMHLCAGWYRISHFEGKAGFAVVGVALLSGIAGLVCGLLTARLVPLGGMAGFSRSLAIAGGIVALLGLLSAGIARALADIPPTIHGRELMLEVEIRLPAGVEAPAADGKSYLHLHSVVRGVARKSLLGRLRIPEARVEEGRTIVPASVHVFTRRGSRALGIAIEGRPPFGFLVPLPARPKPAHETWSGWLPRPPKSLPSWPDTSPSFRFRVQRAHVAEAEL